MSFCNSRCNGKAQQFGVFRTQCIVVALGNGCVFCNLPPMRHAGGIVLHGSCLGQRPVLARACLRWTRTAGANRPLGDPRAMMKGDWLQVAVHSSIDRMFCTYTRLTCGARDACQCVRLSRSVSGLTSSLESRPGLYVGCWSWQARIAFAHHCIQQLPCIPQYPLEVPSTSSPAGPALSCICPAAAHYTTSSGRRASAGPVVHQQPAGPCSCEGGGAAAADRPACCCCCIS